MKNCIVYGNCQTDVIKTYLSKTNSFSSEYEIFPTKAVHLSDPSGIDEDFLNNCDLFIYQPVGTAYGERLSTDYILSRLPQSCVKISIPNAYFRGYHPQDGQRPKIKNDPKYPHGKFPYGDININKMVQEGMESNVILEKISSDDFYSREQVNAVLDGTLNELKRREELLDITISDFIYDKFRDHYLFYTVNHPSYMVIQQVVKRILNKLEIDSSEIESIVLDPFSDRVCVPIYPSVIKNLGLTFLDKEQLYSFHFWKSGKRLSFLEYVSEYIDYVTEG